MYLHLKTHLDRISGIRMVHFVFGRKISQFDKYYIHTSVKIRDFPHMRALRP